MLRSLFGPRKDKKIAAINTPRIGEDAITGQTDESPSADQISKFIQALVAAGQFDESTLKAARIEADLSATFVEKLQAETEVADFLGSATSAISRQADLEPKLADSISQKLVAAVSDLSKASAWHELGVALKSASEPALAARSFARSVKVTPGFYNLWHLSILLIEQGKVSEGLQSMTRAVELDLGENAAEQTRNRQRFFAPLALIAKGNWEECLNHAEGEARKLADKQQGWIKNQFASILSGVLDWLNSDTSKETARSAIAALIVAELYGITSRFRFQPFEHKLPIGISGHSSEAKLALLDLLLRIRDSVVTAPLILKISQEPDLLADERLGALCKLATYSNDRSLLRQIAKRWSRTSESAPETNDLSGFAKKLEAVLADQDEIRSRVLSALSEAEVSDARPEVTIVVPAYNAARFLTSTLESIKAQQFDNFECIIVDDGSTDKETGKIALSFARSDPRFRVIRHLANSGLSAARNSGIRSARAEKICFLDADDLLMPESIGERSRQMDLDAFPLLAGTYSGSLPIPETATLPPPAQPIELEPVNFITTAGDCPFNANQPMFYTSVIRQMGGFDESMTQAEDYDMWARIFRAGYVMTPVQQINVTYRQRADSMIRSNPMHHLSASMSIKDRANKRLDPRMVAPGSPAPYFRAWYECNRDMASVKRAFQFAGMALAQGRSVTSIAEEMDISLQDCSVNVGKEAITAGLAGYKRQLTKAGPNSVWKENHVVSELYELFAILKGRDTYQPDASLQHDEAEVSRIIYPGSQGADILFLPHKDYHLQTIQTISNSFQERDLSWGVVDLSCHYRDEGVRAKAKECGVDLIGIANFMLGYFRPKAIVAFNDWDPIVRNIFAAARKAGVVTCSIVEGIQDYHDVDTGRPRGAYRSSEYVFLPGEFDKRYFKETEQNVEVAGIPRVAELRNRSKTPLPSKKVALINSNFSYGVLTEARDEWVQQAVEGAIAAGFELVITRHPADLGKEFPELVTDLNFYEAVDGASVVVNRFASGVLEALAMGRPVVYFNPHGEKVDKFKDPMGAYPIANDQTSYLAALNDVLNNLQQYKQHWEAFLDMHTGSASEGAQSALTEALAKIVRSANPDASILREELAKLDLASSSLSDLKKLRELAPHYSVAT